MKNHYLVLLVVLMAGCKTSKMDVSKSGADVTIPVREYSVQSVLWQQLSAEYRALCHQAFNLAKIQLDGVLLSNSDRERRLAIITDIDETLVDNSPYNAKMIETDKGYAKEDWIAWGLLEQADAVPGALEFLQYAESRGVEVFYISNRYHVQHEETQSNLKKLGFPYMDDEHILLRTTSSGKEERRAVVLEEHDVIMLLGDNLSDFAEVFDGRSTDERNGLVEHMKNQFGAEFIVLPNPMYGDWESKGLYEGNYNWTAAQKDSIRKAKLISY